MKGFGILCAVSSLPSKCGVGDFGKEAYAFVDLLAKNNVNFWQILPLTKTNEYNCPYGSNSANTIDEMYVDLESLVEIGLLKKEQLKFLEKYQKTIKVDYSPVKENKLKLFEMAYENIDASLLEKAKKFASQNEFINDYAYFETLLEKFNQKDWHNIDKQYWKMNSQSAKNFIKENKSTYEKYIFFQYVLFGQWKKLKKYANDKKIKILGDLPIYCEQTSLEVFKNPQYFKLDKDLRPLATGGCPPDMFSSNGQDWGTCIYNWNELKKDGYKYMIDRIKNALEKYDYLRLDHFIGLVEHYENSKVKTIPSAWYKEGGDELFKAIEANLDTKKIFLEDLGLLSEECKRVRDKYNLKGMNILQYAFDGNEKNEYLPQNVRKNSIYYLGNHDNNTFMGFLESLNKNELKRVKEILKSEAKTLKQLHFDAIKSLFESKVDVVILQVQDVLLQGEDSRMNYPGRSENCWEYKLPKNYAKTFEQNIQKI